MLQKKQTQSKGIVGQKQVGCCGMSSNRVAKYTKIKSYDANFVD